MTSKHLIKQQQQQQQTFNDGKPFNYEELNVIGTGKYRKIIGQEKDFIVS